MQLYEIILSKVIDNSKVKDVLPNEFTFGQFDQVKINPIQKSTEMSIADLYKNRFKQQSNLITQKFYIYNKEINTIIEDNFKFRFVTIFYYNEYYFFKLPKINLESDKVKMHAFNTIDNCAYIVITYAKSYKDGLEAINKISYQNAILSDNSYTIVTLKEINTNEDQVDLQMTLTMKNKESVKKNVESLNDEIVNLDVESSISPIPGNKDIQVNLKQIKFKDFYNFYCNQIVSKQLFTDVSTVIILSVNLNQFYNFNNGDTIDCDKMCNLSKLVLPSIEDKKHYFERSNLSQFINLFNNNDYYKGVCLSLYPSMYSFITTKDYYTDPELMSTYSQEVHEIVKVLTESSFHTNHDPISESIQYLVPEKLITFYTCFLYGLKDKYRENDTTGFQFDFLVKPVMGKNISIRKLQKEIRPTNRILLVMIPIDHMFNVDMALFELVHELFHFIHDNARDREKRFNAISQCIQSYMVEQFTRLIDTYPGIQHDKKVKTLAAVAQMTKDQMSMLSVKEDPHRYYLTSVFDFLQEYGDYLVSNYRNISDYLNFLLDTEGIDFSEVLMYICATITKENKDNMSKLWELIVFYFRECFADVMAINVLNVDINDYVRYFYQSNNIKTDEEISDEAILRIGFVCKTCYTNVETIRPETINGKVKGKIESFIKNEDLQTTCFYDEHSINAFKSYLSEVNQKIKAIINDQTNEEHLKYTENLQNVYKSMKQISTNALFAEIDTCMGLMEPFVVDYLKKYYPTTNTGVDCQEESTH